MERVSDTIRVRCAECWFAQIDCSHIQIPRLRAPGLPVGPRDRSAAYRKTVSPPRIQFMPILLTSQIGIDMRRIERLLRIGM